MASPESPDELHAESETDTHRPQPPFTPITDLSIVPGTELRKLTDNIIVVAESGGKLYAPIFRQLQIRPDKHQDFHNGVIRVIRNKHYKQIQRASDRSLKNVTDLLVRAFGYIIWKTSSEWVLDETDLDEEEAKLVYVRGKNQTPDTRYAPRDSAQLDAEYGMKMTESSLMSIAKRYHRILEPLWRQMRNVMFIRRPQGPAHRARAPSSAATDGEDSYMADADTRSSSPAAAFHARARARASRKLEKLASQITQRVPAHSNQRMSPECTEDAIIELIARLAKIRADSDPQAFEELWRVHIMRVEELDRGQGTNQATPEKEGVTVSVVTQTEELRGFAGDHDNDREQGASQSNVPFMTDGAPLLPRTLVSRSLIPPSLPSLMSVYISVSCLPTRSHFNSISHTTAAPLAQAYHWPSAPVEEHTLAPFFTGICYRVDISPSAVLGRSENATVRRPASVGACSLLADEETGGGDDQVNSVDHCQNGGVQDRDSVDPESMMIASGLPEVAVSSLNSTPLDSFCPPSLASRNDPDDFTEADWQTIALGWRDFQNDLCHAARMGVRVWRMKVCVITAGS
ncbi:uncharacterized protein Z519_05741 [Cladophialophora bantiana CBS 173.52]|uniref:Uncharacterized protein n=1 Tax=Cladophialophora bantiana (strain ATCC 10958 / CBS 173.52 / CDC B-1940 / NIH 8579) TaxID=1442370 RepID=A0A0D2ET97_CLAB1|nr:uncharacterized protein Z519_05741 [Cladophialophora bantiana CBS 173.52]KIW93136.1 hypothetical protein Z519_05741 [Cladophialophora bantiana CBS 173.52]